MFNINEAATIYIYIEYILPIVIFVIVLLYIVIRHFLLKFKLYRINRAHDVERIYSDIYWYTYKCRRCGKVLYKQPSSVNSSLSGSDYIFRYTGKCK